MSRENKKRNEKKSKGQDLGKELGLNHGCGTPYETIKIRMHWPFVENHGIGDR